MSYLPFVQDFCYRTTDEVYSSISKRKNKNVFTVSIDFSDLEDILAIDAVAQRTVKQAIQNLASATHAHILEGAQAKLHTRRRMFVDALSMFEDGEGCMVVSLDASMVWIDNGMTQHSMLESLLASPKAKTAKDGSKYIVVPFSHNKPKQDLTPAQQTLLQTIRQNLKDVGQTPNGIETDGNGTPRLGLVRKMDIMQSPIKTMEGPGQGHGPIGEVRQGPTGIPFLKGTNVFQSKYTKKDGTEGISRSIMTFRVASSKYPDKWRHPGLEPIGLMDEAAQWARNELETKIGPSIAQQIAIQLSG